MASLFRALMFAFSICPIPRTSLIIEWHGLMTVSVDVLDPFRNRGGEIPWPAVDDAPLLLLLLLLLLHHDHHHPTPPPLLLTNDKTALPLVGAVIDGFAV
ncbi:hypothetical protein B7494_g7351 [Chlorociboria aeruginascens]|nr:hypothetical protein B7494_g7351 [Chlorociboria aeruginascens]